MVKFRGDPPIYEPDPQTKTDALVRKHTVYRSLVEMCKNNPTLRAPSNASEKTKRDFAQLRKTYAHVTGKPAIK